jgi:hypothetical protein
MRISLPVALILSAALAAPVFAQRPPPLVPGKVQPDPERAVPGFKPHQLPFETPKDGRARAEHRSVYFYAVILKSAKRCAVTEQERLEVQKLFPANKVFVPMFECEQQPEDTINYSNTDASVGFIAVYAGANRKQGQEFLETVKQTGKFPGANLRRMQAILHYP